MTEQLNNNNKIRNKIKMLSILFNIDLKFLLSAVNKIKKIEVLVHTRKMIGKTRSSERVEPNEMHKTKHS